MKACVVRPIMFVAIYSVVVLTAGCSQTEQYFVPLKEEKPGKIVTKENSSQYAKDYDAIDTLGFMASGDPITSDGILNWKEPRWKITLSADQAAPAHRLLRELLADHPLCRPFLGTQNQFYTADTHGMCFFREGDQKTLDGFTIKIFDCEYVEIEYWANIPKPKGSTVAVCTAGTRFPLKGDAKAKIYWFMANCTAKTNPESSKAFRGIAEGIWRQQRTIMATWIVLAIVGVSAVIVLALWITRRRDKSPRS